MSRNKVKKSLKLLLSNKVDKQRLIPATLGAKIKGKEKVKVPNRDQYVYVRIHGRDSEIAQAFNDKTNYVYGLPVLLQKEGNRYIVTGRDTLRYPEWLEYRASLPPHGWQHSYFGGTDITWIHKKQFTPFGVSPISGTSVIVREDWFLLDDNYFHFTGTAIDLAGAFPSVTNQALFLSLYFDTNTRTIAGITGSIFDTNPFPDNFDSFVPSMHISAGIPLASILLTSTNKAVTWNSIYDIRPFLVGKSSSYSSPGSIRIYDNGAFKVTGTAINFRNGFTVDTAGAMAVVDSAIIVRKNTGSNVGERPRINFIEGAGVTISIADDAIDNEFDITFSTTGSSSGGSTSIVKDSYIFRIDGTIASTSGTAGVVVPYTCTISPVYISLDYCGTTGTTIVDVLKNGTTIFTTPANRPTLPYNDANKVAVSGNPDITTISAEDVLSINIISAATKARGLNVTIPISYSVALDADTLDGHDSTYFATANHTHKFDIPIILGNAVDVITAGTYGYVRVPRSATINGWTIMSKLSGSIVVDVKRATYANFPTTTSIAGTEKPTLTSAYKNTDTILSTWTTSISEGDILEFYVESATTVKQVSISLHCTG